MTREWHDAGGGAEDSRAHDGHGRAAKTCAADSGVAVIYAFWGYF